MSQQRRRLTEILVQLSTVAATTLLSFGCTASAGPHASTASADTNGPTSSRLDRMGRPEITNLTMGYAALQSGAVGRYNQENTFHMSAAGTNEALAAISTGIANLDQLDGQTDWSDDDRNALAQTLLEDVLIVDVSEPCTVDNPTADTPVTPTYLDIERASLTGSGSYASCGGRLPGDNIIDDMMTLLISHQWDFQTSDRHVTDNEPTGGATLSGTFPYLGDPHPVSL